MSKAPESAVSIGENGADILADMLSSNFKSREAPRMWCLCCPRGGPPIYVRTRDAAILIRSNGYTHEARAATVEQAKFHIGRWVSAQRTKPEDSGPNCVGTLPLSRHAYTGRPATNSVAASIARSREGD